MKIKTIRKNLVGLIEELSASPQLFLKDPDKDFTRKRKLSFRDTVSLLLQMEGNSTTNELLSFFKCSTATPTASAFRQQRDKILPEALDFLFREFTESSMDNTSLYMGYHLFAVDGSDLLTATGPSDPASYFPGTNDQRAYNILHLNALYDLEQKVYVDALVQKSRNANEPRAVCSMVDRSPVTNAILLADRGYESYNILAHLQEKGWKYLFRIKDGADGIASGLDLPNSAEFDLPVSLNLSNKQTNAMKERYKDRNHYKYIASKHPFDYLPSKNRKYDPVCIYTLHFRIVRFKISDDLYETVITNLSFPPEHLKKLYAMRWGIETSFRDLKYTIGLSFFHSKKVEHILQEIFARLTMYNFAELITQSVVIRQKSRKYPYQINFSAAVHICREFFRGNVSPPDVEALIVRYMSPIRQDRKRPRKLAPKGVISFIYRVA
ncbi:MAG: IS4 family transposase [Acetatifactor sp.]|nr:IS4 family transposase [Acetatifactor sp.]